MKLSISILIPAYNAQDFIEECLDSIQNQIYFKDFNDYEILVGIDNCEKTKEKLLSIRDKYKNLRIFWMEKNKGTYITKNTLVTLSKYNIIQFFDSDDIMLPDMIHNSVNLSNKYDLVIHKSESIKEINGCYERTGSTGHPGGVLCFKKNILEKLGSFKPWVCAADTEFMNRADRIFNNIKTNDVQFLYRAHLNSLTSSKETGRYSVKRKEYAKIINSNRSNTDIYVKPEINTFKEIF